MRGWRSLRVEPLDVAIRRSDNRRTMAELYTPRRNNLRRVLASLIAVMVVAGAPARAQTPKALQELDASLTDLKAMVDQAKQESATPNPIDRISKQVDTLRTRLDQAKEEANGASATPREAWWTLWIVGGAFAIAWGFVSWSREKTRQAEEATRKAEAEDA